jgi:TrmH family RNA methyltransferase
LFNPNCVRASVGALFSVPVCAATREETIAWLRERGVSIYAARLDAACDYTQVDYTRPCAIVLGNEAVGLGAEWTAKGIVGIRVPMLGVADSLNVSATAAVVFYEARRQRGLAARSPLGRG